jgi:TRAP-type C4-dicarboxylate transport system substrate-binding protein
LGLALSRLGMIPLGLPSNLVSTALDKQWIDAFSTSFDTAKSTPAKPPLMLVDQTPTLIDAKFSTPAQMLIMNKNSYEKLPRDLQLIIEHHAGLEFALGTGRMRDSTENVALRELKANPKFRVLTFSKEDRAEIDERIKPVFEDWVAGMNALGIDGAALLKRTRELSKAGS